MEFYDDKTHSDESNKHHGLRNRLSLPNHNFEDQSPVQSGELYIETLNDRIKPQQSIQLQLP